MADTNNLELKDKYTYPILVKCCEKYRSDIKFNEKINQELSNKKRRNENFPSDISENIAKFAIAKKHGIMPNWDTEKGDLVIEIPGHKNLQIEVKGFMSSGPSSFGPNEHWDRIYFVDAIDFENMRFKVFEIQLSDLSEEWRSIKLTGSECTLVDIPELPENIGKLKLAELKELCKNRGHKVSGKKNELIDRLLTLKPGSKYREPKTYGQIADENRRGQLRGGFYSVFQPQLGTHCELIFDGHISELQ